MKYIASVLPSRHKITDKKLNCSDGPGANERLIMSLNLLLVAKKFNFMREYWFGSQKRLIVAKRARTTVTEFWMLRVAPLFISNG